LRADESQERLTAEIAENGREGCEEKTITISAEYAAFM
jgi:hypothetical protein